MANIRARVNPDNVNQMVVDSQDNSPTPFVEVGKGTRWSDAATAAWQEFLLAVPSASRAFKIGDGVDLDLSGVTHNYHVRLGTTWFKVTTGATFGNDAAVTAAGYLFLGNISTLKPS